MLLEPQDRTVSGMGSETNLDLMTNFYETVKDRVPEQNIPNLGFAFYAQK